MNHKNDIVYYLSFYNLKELDEMLSTMLIDDTYPGHILDRSGKVVINRMAIWWGLMYLRKIKVDYCQKMNTI